MISKQFAKVKEHIFRQASSLSKQDKKVVCNKHLFYESIYLEQTLNLTREDVMTLCTLMSARLRSLAKKQGMAAVWETISDGNPLPPMYGENT